MDTIKGDLASEGMDTNMDILVTGAAGFIGRFVINEAWKRGYDTTAFDIANGPQQDVTSYQDVLAAMQDVDAVIHLAGLLGTHELFDNVGAAVAVNVMGTYNVAKAAQVTGIPMVTIEQPHVWTNPYETTRGAGLRLARSLAIHQDLSLATVTVFNAFGKWQAYGGDHPRKIVPTFAVHAWNGLPLPIYGIGDQWTNLIYAEDIAAVFIDVVEGLLDKGYPTYRDEDGTPHVPYFIGGAHNGNMRVIDVARAILSLTDMSRDALTFEPMRPGEDNSQGAMLLKHHLRELDWQGERGVHVPTFNFKQLKETVDWYKMMDIDTVWP